MVQAALRGVGLLSAGEHLMVGRSGVQGTGERGDRGIAEGSAAPQGRYLLLGLDQPQPGVGGISDAENPSFLPSDTLRCWTSGRPARNRTATRPSWHTHLPGEHTQDLL